LLARIARNRPFIMKKRFISLLAGAMLGIAPNHREETATRPKEHPKTLKVEHIHLPKPLIFTVLLLLNFGGV